MKQKVVFLMSIMFMAFVMTGCNKDDNDNDNGNDHGRPGRDCYELSISNIGEQSSIIPDSILFNITTSSSLVG